MARGGRRAATPGQGYANRTDLSAGAGKIPQPTFTSTSYGASTALQQATNAVPVAPQPQPGPPPTPGSGNAGSAPGAGVAAAPTPAPGSFGDHLRPTEQPDVPVTAGLPFGPGPGPSAPVPAPSPLLSALANLNALGSAASPLVNAVRSQVNALTQAGAVQ